MKHITQLIITAAMLLMTQTAGAQKNIAREPSPKPQAA